MIKNGKIHISIPNEYMGKMIGKQGKNIREVQETLKQKLDLDTDIKIILHPQDKGTITLEQIENAIENQKQTEIK